MQTLSELGHEVALRRRQLGLKQGDVARAAGIAQEMLSRFERGRCAEFGSRKLLAVDRPAFRRHPVAIIDGNDRGVYGQQQAVHG